MSDSAATPETLDEGPSVANAGDDASARLDSDVATATETPADGPTEEAESVRELGLLPSHPLAAAYEQVAAALPEPAEGTALRVALTSTRTGEGVSTAAINLAAVLAAAPGERVVLIDGNLADAALATMLETSETPGWPEAALGRVSLDEALIELARDRFWLLPAGDSRGELPLPATPLARLLDELDSRATRVVIDLPSLDSAGGMLAMAGAADGAVLVVAAEETRIEAVRWAREQFEQARVPLFGAVLNRRQLHIPPWIYDRC